ncbi:MAG: hypothetical protein LBT43_06765 [Prevotella sp.]|jgi:hypothetical protein|nr:hypothetical protein [Prevotella sp.]
MITIREIQGNEENYTWWLTIMPDVMYNLQLLPKNVSSKLDYSVESLNILELYIIENYNMEELKLPNYKTVVDLFSRYIGETFRKNIKDTIWEMENRKDYFGYGFPMINKKNNIPFTKVLPSSILFGSIANAQENNIYKTGEYLSGILKHKISEEK